MCVCVCGGGGVLAEMCLDRVEPSRVAEDRGTVRIKKPIAVSSPKPGR